VALKIATRELEPVKSCLSLKKKGLSRLILEAVGIKLATTEPELLKYMQSTLLWQQNKGDEVDGGVEWLVDQGKYALDFLVYNEILIKVPGVQCDKPEAEGSQES
jgi:hypothetical protein